MTESKILLNGIRSIENDLGSKVRCRCTLRPFSADSITGSTSAHDNLLGTGRVLSIWRCLSSLSPCHFLVLLGRSICLALIVVCRCHCWVQHAVDESAFFLSVRAMALQKFIYWTTAWFGNDFLSSTYIHIRLTASLVTYRYDYPWMSANGCSL